MSVCNDFPRSFGYGTTTADHEIGERPVIREIFNEIQKQTSKTVIYNDDRLQLDQKIKADFKDIRLEELLDRILTERGMGYKLVDDYIVIIPKEEQAVPQVVQDVSSKELL